ncbi:chromatin assembly factor 1 subunit B-like isoform X1 [Eriocheir sinensis]|uniref:chromatin assembly factor 1 subunit B-like isoform X1 n=1 Tax=Eriocheir sinensis TaxID=95602 RepID=UPI0021C7E2C6|nr:chromatin assembly factor 1 subunit B-like isoform X1 [Eriocheir sinensis]
MKCTIPEISWHNRDPVYSLDIQPSSHDGLYRMATAGTDTHVVIWQLRVLDNGGVSVEALSDLTRHNRAVNAVRFSPDGEHLASADDEAAIILWKKDDSSDIFMEESEKENKEHWTIWKMLRGHLEDVYDLCWSPCSQFLFTGAVDNTAILWDVAKGKSLGILSDHKGFVQGVAWDPLGQYVATLCSDRCCRIYSFETRKIAHKIYKATLPLPDEDKITEKTTKLFYDDTLKSFCRRLSFSPDGELLLAPSGIVEEENGKITNVTYVFSRHNPTKPVLYLPTKDKFTIAVRFCPILFELKPLPQEEESPQESAEPREPWEEHANLFHLPYRMIFAVATQNAVLLYDTQQPVPFARLSNIHYTRLSDISWSSDGRILVASSTDGYCSLVSFAKGELGTPYIGGKNRDSEKHESVIRDSSKVAEHESAEDIEMEDMSRKPLSAVLEQSGKCEEKSFGSNMPVELSKKQGENQTPSRKVPEESCSKQEEEGSKPSSNPTVEPSKKQKDEEHNRLSPSIAENTLQKQKKESKKSSSDIAQEPPNKQITVRRARDSSKSPKRIPLITLSGPSLKNDENTPVSKAESLPPPSTSAEIQEKPEDVDEEVRKRFEGESVTPSKVCKNLSPSKTPTGKTPRRVPLITLASPKGKKSSSECR